MVSVTQLGVGDLIICPTWKEGKDMSVGMIKAIKWNSKDKEHIFVTFFPLENVTDCIPISSLAEYVSTGEWKVKCRLDEVR